VNRFVVDASVAIKWYLPEPHSADADRLLGNGFQLLAPDLLVIEAGNILWKRIMRSELTVRKAQIIMRALEALPMTFYPASVLAENAMTVACGLKRSFYDSLYLALALTTDCRLVTADRKLFDAVRDAAPVRKHILWIEDVPERNAPDLRS
jgi:predicted nucleic acid-binding protein